MKLARWFWPVLGVALFVVTITGHANFFLGVLGGIIVLFSWAAALNRRQDRALHSAPSGAVRVETVKQVYANQKVQQYARAGWQLSGQSSSKSVGSQARVTLTFRKP